MPRLWHTPHFREETAGPRLAERSPRPRLPGVGPYSVNAPRFIHKRTDHWTLRRLQVPSLDVFGGGLHDQKNGRLRWVSFTDSFIFRKQWTRVFFFRVKWTEENDFPFPYGPSFTDVSFIVPAPEKRMMLTQSKPDLEKINITCIAQGIYPEPRMALYKDPERKSKYEQLTAFKPQLMMSTMRFPESDLIRKMILNIDIYMRAFSNKNISNDVNWWHRGGHSLCQLRSIHPP